MVDADTAAYDGADVLIFCTVADQVGIVGLHFGKNRFELLDENLV